MLESLSYALYMLLILSGLFFFFYILINRLLFRTGKDEFFTVVVGKSGDKNLSDKIYSAFVQANTLNFSSRKTVIVLDCGLSEEEKQLCRNVLDPENNLIFLHSEYIGDEYIVICLDKE